MRAFGAIYCFLFLLAATAAIVTSSSNAAATGFGVSPSSIDFAVEKGSSASRQLIIYSTGADAQFVAISESPEVTVAPSAGILSESKPVVVTVTATGKKLGKSGSEILISLAHNSGNAGNEVRFSLGTRVGISLSVVERTAESANPLAGMLTSSAIVVGGLSAYLTLRRKNARLLPAKA